MSENFLQVEGIRIILNKKLSPLQMKVKGFYNGLGMEIVQEIEVSKEIYSKLELE